MSLRKHQYLRHSDYQDSKITESSDHSKWSDDFLLRVVWRVFLKPSMVFLQSLIMMRIYSLLLIVLIAASCDKSGVTIEGKAKGYKSEAIFIEKKKGMLYVNIDTVFIRSDSTFKFTLHPEGYGRYRLNFNYSNRVPLLIGKNDLKIEVDAGHLHGQYKIEGSPDYKLKEEINAINKNFDNLKSLVKIKEQYRLASQRADRQAMDDARVRYNKALEEKRKMIEEIILEGLDNGAYLGVVETMYAIMQNPATDLAFYKKVAKTLEEKIPNEAITQEFRGYVSVISKGQEIK